MFADVRANGAPTRALVDTGSPATIISMDFVLNIFADQKDRQQHPEQVMKRFSPPEVSLRNYGGDPLSIISQTPETVKRGLVCRRPVEHHSSLLTGVEDEQPGRMKRR